jgi:Family of unknown function (DUF6011)
MNQESITIGQALKTAKLAGNLWPSCKVGPFTFKLANKLWPQQVVTYVTDSISREYLGKIMEDGKVYCYPNLADSMALAKTYWLDVVASIKIQGQQTGSCCFCGRQLLNGLSVATMIGPICAEKYGIAREQLAPSTDTL